MCKKYWLHRISHERKVSYPLFEKGYLSLGWSAFSDTKILESVRNDDTANEFENIYRLKRSEEKASRARWNMWYFAKFNVGDIVIVPLFDGKFSVCKVEEQAKPISDICEVINELGKNIAFVNGRVTQNSEVVDLGFVVKVSVIKHDLKRREYADSAMTARMKMRQTNGDISDLSDNIEKVINAKKPINFYENAIESGSAALLKIIKKDLTPEKFELLVKAYMEKIGADYTYIPSKNEHGKSDYADADVIAVFNSLKVTVQIQVKYHENNTSDWAVEQIIKYKEQLEDENTELTHFDESNVIILWVISSGDDFTDKAKEMSVVNNVRLVNGQEFSRMLIDVGLGGLDI